jgi:hypothetical protein
MSLFQPLNELEKLLGHSESAEAPSAFPPNSRYYGHATTSLTTTEGTAVVYLRRRFIPRPESFAVMAEYVVNQSDRLDNMAAKFLNDPEKFWLLCDANRASNPEELEIVGRRLRITFPEGVPATQGNG